MIDTTHLLTTLNIPEEDITTISNRIGTFLEKLHTSFGVEDSRKIHSALMLMLELHADQKPRPDGLPYVTHVLDVAMCAYTLMAHKDPEVLIAALLHDTVEDQTPKLLQRTHLEFQHTDKNPRELALNYLYVYTKSKRVQNMVAHLSNPPFDEIVQRQDIFPGPDASSQNAYIQAKNVLYAEHVHAVIQDPDVALVKLADFMTNALNIDTVPDQEKRTKYLRKYTPVLEKFIQRLQDTCQPLNLIPEMRDKIVAQLYQARERMHQQLADTVTDDHTS